MYVFCERRSVPGDLLWYTSACFLATDIWLWRHHSHPTLTQVPPSLLLSIAIVFAPCTPLALRAQARPPLPPPITRKSHSFVIGAIFAAEDENCREREESLVLAVCGNVFWTERARIVKALMGRYGDVLIFLLDELIHNDRLDPPYRVAPSQCLTKWTSGKADRCALEFGIL